MATAKIFMNGRSQAVRLPAEFRFEGTEVEIERDKITGGVLLTEKPADAGAWEAFFRARAAIPVEELEEFLEDRDQGFQERDDPLA